MNEEIIRGSSVKVAFIVGSIEGLVFLHTMPTTYKFQKIFLLEQLLNNLHWMNESTKS